ncbi:helix-turn-helix domain-containing protein [Microtetraspora malaysiensis]|uniref:helix-turn-helix domain-containing protein n=1 Tax=Microtetraspora malaysiensis TaxID=161358 RepID=UPI003D8F61FF
MPGGRLTFEDRQRIAEGLAAKLTCAEIARRLGRPRSTVMREIARNGGLHAYQASRAQRATSWRARRRKPIARPDSSSDTPDTDGRTTHTMRELEEQLSAMMIETGMPSMSSRVFTALFVSDSGSLTAAELVQRLNVSPAAISKAISWLEQRELVGRKREGRRERYIIDVDDVWYRAWLASARSMALWADATRRGAGVLGTATPAGSRLHTASQFFDLLGHDMAQAAEHWRQRLSAQCRPSSPPQDGGGTVTSRRTR